jgi:hypothetical protein
MYKLNPNFNQSNPYWNTEYVVVTIPAGQTPSRINFPDVQNIRNVHLSKLITYTDQEIPVSIGGIPTVAFSVIVRAFLTLQLYNGVEKIHQLPMIEILNGLANGIPTVFENSFVGQKVNWPKSYIELEGIVVDPANDRNFVFCVQYAKTEEEESRDAGYEFKKNMQ